MADSPYIVEVTDANFVNEVIERSFEVPVLVDFWAEWCQPCKMLMPVLARLAQEYAGRFILAKVNTEEQRQVAGQFGIRSIPTVKLFSDGRELDEFAGALPESGVREFLDRHLPARHDPIVEQALALMDQGNLDAADELLDEALRQDGSNLSALLGKAQLQLMAGDFDAAETTLDALPADKLDDPQAVQLRAQLPFLRVLADAPPIDELHPLAAAGDSHARYQLAAHLLYQQQFEGALELLFDIMRRDRAYGDDAARKAMLAVFDMLGGEGDLVKRWRGRMFAAMH